MKDSSAKPGRRPFRKAMPIAFVVLGFCILLGFAVRKWDAGITSSRDAAPRVFSGGSAHWDESEVPISARCGACHEKEFKDWAASDHAWAFRKMDPRHDSEAFQNMVLQAHGSELKFRTGHDGRRQVHDKESNREWLIEWATGRMPLVQYLVAAPDGGYHTLSASWDVEKKEWFDIFDDDTRSIHDWGHWKGRGMNWNSQCAWCHMSSFRKNYDYKTDRYASTWKEPGVTCIQCHGPLLDHPEEETGCMISTTRKMTPRQHHDNCATCHARRDELDDGFKAGDRFDDHFRLVLPVHEGIFWPNGMQRDEDYCETGLRLSPMGKAGVTCLDCHDPHTATLKLPQEDNSLCMRCHGTGERVNDIAAPVIDPVAHSPCPPGSKGDRCVECHMPESIYMARDPRRDHSFNSPDPLLSVELGIPNACTMCHRGRSDEWAAQVVENFYGAEPSMAKYRDRTRAVQMAYLGDPGARAMLLKALDGETNATWRATILLQLENWRIDPEVLQAAGKYMTDPEPIARAAAARIVAANGGQAKLVPMLQDGCKLVRIEAAWLLRDQLGPGHKAYDEMIRTSLYQSDQPAGAMRMAQIEAGRGNIAEAESWYEKAVQWDATSPVVYRDYAVFLSSQQRYNDAWLLMRKAASLAPEDAGIWYLQGLAAAEVDKLPEALSAFTRAVEIDPGYIRARYNRALLYHQLGRSKEAAADLEECMRLDPNEADFPYTLGVIYYETGNKAQAAACAAQALRVNSSHQSARILLQQASR